MSQKELDLYQLNIVVDWDYPTETEEGGGISHGVLPFSIEDGLSST
jgi:hypothetical protein